MSKLKILEYPDPRLRTKAVCVESVDDELRQLAADMLETMYEAPGIGLAATQVDVHLRLLVADVSEDQSQPLVLINPEITEQDGIKVHEEGCLSVPGVYEKVERPGVIRVKYLDLNGKTQEMSADGLIAVCVQHEVDHLDGKLFVDYLSELKRQRVRKRLAKDRKLKAEDDREHKAEKRTAF